MKGIGAIPPTRNETNGIGKIVAAIPKLVCILELG